MQLTFILKCKDAAQTFRELIYFTLPFLGYRSIVSGDPGVSKISNCTMRLNSQLMFGCSEPQSLQYSAALQITDSLAVLRLKQANSRSAMNKHRFLHVSKYTMIPCLVQQANHSPIHADSPKTS